MQIPKYKIGQEVYFILEGEWRGNQGVKFTISKGIIFEIHYMTNENIEYGVGFEPNCRWRILESHIFLTEEEAVNFVEHKKSNENLS